MKRLMMLTTAALFAGGSAFAQSMQDWDSDTSGDLSRDEWSTGMNSGTTFSDWDSDTDGSLNGEEFATGMFQRFDKDEDGSLTSSEWDDGFDRWYGEQGVDLDVAQWDTDGDNMIGESEFTQQFETAGLFDQFRTNANMDTTSDGIAQEDFSGGMFDWMDRNRDQTLDADENVWND